MSHDQHPAVTLSCPEPTMSPEISTFLDRSLPYRPRVEALQNATREGSPELIALIRRELREEKDPFVLATMAAALGKLGDQSDHLRLRMLLHHEDDRVVANTLEALMKLGIALERITLLELIASRDARVAGNALVRLAEEDVTAALEYVERHYVAMDGERRDSAVHALRRMPDHPGIVGVLEEIFQLEDRPPVLRLVAELLERHLTTLGAEEAREAITPLVLMRSRVRGTKFSLIDQLLYQFAPETR